MALLSFWGRDEKLRIIKTLRGQKSIDSAIAKGATLIFRKVEPFSTVKGKYCIVKNKRYGLKFKIYDFRDRKNNSDEYEVIRDWTYVYHHYDFPQEAAYVVPYDIKEGEIVLIEDLIENFLSYRDNQGGSKRLKSCEAIWKNNDLQIQYDPDRDCAYAVG
jgi:hypothetical protein